MSVRNLDEIRGWTTAEIPNMGTRLVQTLQDLIRQDRLLEQQTNGNLEGNPTPPPMPESLTVVPHPNGVQYAIQHEGDFYQGVKYEIDYTSNGVTHTHDAGSSRNGFIPNGAITASYAVRTLYPSGLSSTPRALANPVTGGTGSYDLLPGQGSGTTRASQPPGFGGTFRGNSPPVRSTRK
jgi:hypothetical protein